jgi:hypothetical protein
LKGKKKKKKNLNFRTAPRELLSNLGLYRK